jgi:hypothetical protein
MIIRLLFYDDIAPVSYEPRTNQFENNQSHSMIFATCKFGNSPGLLKERHCLVKLTVFMTGPSQVTTDLCGVFMMMIGCRTS